MKAIHQQIEGWLDAQAAQSLSPAEQAALTRHLQECPACRQIQQEYQTMSRLLQDDLVEKKPSADFEERLVAQFRQAAEGDELLESRTANASFWSRIVEGLLSLGRLPSVQWSGALAVLVGLVGVGSLLTHERPGDTAKSLKQIIENQGIYVETAKAGIVLSGYVDSGYQYCFGPQPINGAPSPTAAPSFRADYGNQDIPAAPPSPISSDIAAGLEEEKNATLAQFRNAQAKASALPELNSFTLAPNKDNDASATASLFSNIIPTYHTGALATNKLKAISDSNSPATGSTYEIVQAPTNSAITYGSLAVPTAQITLASNKATRGADTAQASSAPPLPPTATDDSRKVIRNAHLEFEVAKFDDAVAAIDAAAKQQDGFIDTKESVQRANGKIAGRLTVKVLPDHLDAFLAQIAPIGDLKNQQIGADDITKDYYDTDARLRNAQKMEQRLLDLLDAKTGKISDLLQVEQELGRVRSQIEQMQGEMKAYDALIRYATVTIVLEEKDLTQAAAFVIREQADLQLLSSDVEKSYHDALTAIDAAHGQILESGLVREDGGRVHGSIRLQVDPDGAEGLITALQALGRVAHFSKEDQEVAQGGDAASATAQTKRERVAITLTINHDEEVRQTVGLTVVGKEVEALFEQAKQAATAQGAELLNSNLQKTEDGSTVAHLTVRVPSATFEALRDSLQGLGRVTALTVNRNDGLAPTADADRAPVQIDLTLADEETPIEQACLTVLTDNVDAKVAALK